MFSIESFYQTYNTETVVMKIGDKPFSFITPQNLDELMDTSEDSNIIFPLWVKIWESSIILADYLINLKKTSKKILELGAGLGITSIIAESFGYRVTSTEYDSQALKFLMANAHINDCQTLNIQRLNWHEPDIVGQFDIIVGSELVYKESDFKPLIALFQKFLLPGGEIILANEPRKSLEPFLNLLKQSYHIEIRRKRLRASDETKTILMTRLTGKNAS
jgi:predicted nicotinamide N-methyase